MKKERTKETECMTVYWDGCDRDLYPKDVRRLLMAEYDLHRVLTGDYQIGNYYRIGDIDNSHAPFLIEVEKLESLLTIFIQHRQDILLDDTYFDRYFDKKKNLSLADKRKSIAEFWTAFDKKNHTEKLKFFHDLLIKKPNEDKPSIVEAFVKSHAEQKPKKASKLKTTFLTWCETNNIDLRNANPEKVQIKVTASNYPEPRPSYHAIKKWVKTFNSTK